MVKKIYSTIKQGSVARKKKRLKFLKNFGDDKISQKKIKQERKELENEEANTLI